ncbi:conserved hypothetical protein [Mucor ambiguus]|uniref:IPT/TIG domain-containing protein n=1 Tax=Mucor ambiguus TaxID=91626 RepID=A0A0C9MSW9_9FUNG|nr:conserved hypothetical protein [Mucor ambiguus]
MITKTHYCVSQFDTSNAVASSAAPSSLSSMSPPTSPLDHSTFSPYQLQNELSSLDENLKQHQQWALSHSNVYQPHVKLTPNPSNRPSYEFHHPFGNRSETTPIITSNDSLQIRVDGIPDSGAKSRVETQIKLCVSLTTKDGMKAPYWSYIRIPDSMLARSKLRKSQQQKLLDGSAATMVSDESKVLDLEARVICESDENKKIKMCQGCVRRERKRAQRKKDAKPSIHEMNAGVMDEAFERDRQRILLINCEPLVNFSTGDAILPIRITCYCRHHNERIGFRVRFALRNDKGMVVATGESPPIMITDDHKSPKQRAPSLSVSRKRRRAVSSEAEDEFNALATPVSSRKTSVCESEPEYDRSPHDTPVITASTASMNLDYFASVSDTITSSNTSSVLGHFTTSPLPTPREENASVLSTSPKTPTTATSDSVWQSMLSYGPVQLPVNDMSNLHHRRTQRTPTSTRLSHPILLQDNDFDLSPNPRRRRIMEDIMIADTCSPSLLTVASMPSFATSDYSSYAMDSSVSVSRTAVVSSGHPVIPTLDRIVPSQGPTTGGVEITILGENFHRGLTLMFGNRAATTVCCNYNSIICILPPAEHNGPVVVSFKEHPLMRTSPVPPLFDYLDSSHQDVVSLSNRVIGAHTPSAATTNPSGGYFQHAIISNPSQQSSLMCTATTPNTADSHGEASSDYFAAVYQQNIELHILEILSCASFDSSRLAQTTLGGQNLLHLAAYLNYPALAAFLISKSPALAQAQDRNGVSPLHFGCHAKADLIIQLLLKAGASVGMASSIGTPIDLVGSMLNSREYNDMERQLLDASAQFPELKVSPVSWLPSLFVYAASRFYQRNNITQSPCIDFYLANAAIPVQDSGSLLYQV